MSFEERFELGDLLRDDGIQTFAVKDKTTGQSLLAHYFVSAAETAALLSSLDHLPEQERHRIIDQGYRAGVPYVITGSLGQHPGFREWLTAGAPPAAELRRLEHAGAWKVILPPSVPGSSPPKQGIDEQFFSLFQTAPRPQQSGGNSPPRAEPALPEAPQKAPVPASKPADPGEFTRLFKAQPAPAQVAPVQLPPVPAPSVQPAPAQPAQVTPVSAGPTQPSPASAELGEFTRLFKTQPAPAQPAPSAPAQALPTQPSPAPVQAQPFPSTTPRPAAANPPGEFTRMFQAQPSQPLPGPPQAPPAQAPQAPLTQASAPKAPAAAPPANAPGEFTRMFQAPATAPQNPIASRPPVAPASKQQNESEFNQFFQGQMAPNPLPPGPTPMQATSRPAKEGEFTRVFGKGELRPMAEPQQPFSPSPPPFSSPPAGPLPSAGSLPQPGQPAATRAFAPQKPPPQPAGPGQPAGYSQHPGPGQLPGLGAQGQGSFTVQFSVAPALTLGQPSAETPPAAKPSNKTATASRLPLILGLAAGVILLVAVIVFFATRK